MSCIEGILYAIHVVIVAKPQREISKAKTPTIEDAVLDSLPPNKGIKRSIGNIITNKRLELITIQYIFLIFLDLLITIFFLLPVCWFLLLIIISVLLSAIERSFFHCRSSNMRKYIIL